MTTDLLHDVASGPEVSGTRITVYNLLPYFLDPTATEDYICRLYELTPEQVAAARAYVLNNADTVLAQHLKIEARIAAGNPPEVIEQAKETRARLQKFREWLTDRNAAAAREAADDSAADRTDAAGVPTFREWLAGQESR
jgi:uncharacterized protein (DUF433 family)